MTTRSSLKALEEPAKESQFIQMNTRLQYRGPNIAKLDLHQESRKVLNCVKWGFMSSAADSQSKIDSVLLLPSLC